MDGFFVAKFRVTKRVKQAKEEDEVENDTLMDEDVVQKYVQFDEDEDKDYIQGTFTLAFQRCRWLTGHYSQRPRGDG